MSRPSPAAGYRAVEETDIKQTTPDSIKLRAQHSLRWSGTYESYSKANGLVEGARKSQRRC